MNELRKKMYDKTYMRMANELSKLSYAVRSKVGCLIVSEDGQIVSQGYNGMPHGFNNNCENLVPITNYLKCNYGELVTDDKLIRFIKNHYDAKDYTLQTKPEVLHAESNAISKCAKWNSSTDGATCYVTLSPCPECAKLMIQSGIKRVVYKDIYRKLDGVEMLNNAGIITEQINI